MNVCRNLPFDVSFVWQQLLHRAMSVHALDVERQAVD